MRRRASRRSVSELRLARAARAGAAADVALAAAEALEVLPHAAHTREVVLQLRELDLELALGTAGVLREDVEDQLGAVDDPRVERVLEVTLLRRIELVVDDQRVRARLPERAFELLDLALADVRPLRRARAVLHDRADGPDAGRPRQLPDLGELLRRVRALSEHREHEPALGLKVV